jgi:hypothetical protein
MRRVDSPADLDEGLTMLNFLVPNAELFEAALGLYDLPLAARIVAKGQNDPQEFAPLLRKFSALQGYAQLAAIDIHLSRFETYLNWSFLTDLEELCTILHCQTHNGQT